MKKFLSTLKFARAENDFTARCNESCASLRMILKLTCVRVVWFHREREEKVRLAVLPVPERDAADVEHEFSLANTNKAEIFSVFQRIFYFSVPPFIKFNHSFREV